MADDNRVYAVENGKIIGKNRPQNQNGRGFTIPGGMKRILGTIPVLALGLILLANPSQALAQGYRLLEIDGHLVKWGEPKFGSNALIRYAFADGISRFPLARNCNAIKPLHLYARAGIIPYDRVVAEFEKAANAWSRIGAIKFVRATEGQVPDLVIGAQVRPVGHAFANVTPAVSSAVEKALPASPGDEVKASGRLREALNLQPLRHALICLNSELPWKIGFDGDLETYDLSYTFMHEIGHVLGLNHVSSRNSVMSFRYDETVSLPQPGDIVGIAQLYGRSDPGRSANE